MQLQVIAGDITLDKLGLSAEDLTMIHKECNIIHHCAASVDFKVTVTFSPSPTCENEVWRVERH